MKKKIIAVSVCFGVLIACIGILQFASLNADDRMIADIETASGKSTVNETNAASEPTDILNPRSDAGAFIIGAEDAPVTILEFSSLSCPHCATFHKTALPDLKKDYVETGKVKFVFRDFPLNSSAVAASLLLKCVPLENRYDFMEMLFDQQAQWAFDANYQTKLKQYASLIGIGSDDADACMNDKEAERAMFETMRDGSTQYEISSTPTFIIQPGDEKIVGAQPYGTFSTRIEALIEEQE
jgi:protein-disulfide isomerase